MELMTLLPILGVLLLIIVLKRSPIEAAFFGVLSALILWLCDVATPYSHALAWAIITDTMILFVSVASVIAMGLLLVVLLEKTPTNQAFTSWVGLLNLPKSQSVLLVMLGIAPMLEALTGFGVSLIAIIPILLTLLPKEIALKTALVGMAIMPWGTLGLATVTGASMLGLSAAELGLYSAMVSSPVFMWLALWALSLAKLLDKQALINALMVCAMFVCVLASASKTVGVEIAGVLAGLSVVVYFLLLGKKSPIPKAIWVYAVLFGSVLLLKVVGFLTGWQHWAWQGVQASFKPINSPSIALALTVIVVWWAYRQQYALNAVIHQWLKRAYRPLTTILCFLLMSQIMVKGEFLQGFHQLLNGLPAVAQIPILTMLGAIGGYLTGSNVGGNVLMLPILTDNNPILAAIMNSAAGASALASLPVVAIIAGLAKADTQQEQRLISTALMVAVINTALVAMVGVLLYVGVA